MNAAETRVLWVNHFAIGPGEGGGTRHFEMAKELRKLGWDPTVAASDLNLQTRRYARRSGAEDRAPVREVIQGVRFLWLWSAPYDRNNWRRAWNWLSFARSLLRLENGPWKVVIGSSPHLFAAIAAERLARRLAVPFIFEVRDLWPESLLAAGGRKGPLYYVLAWLAKGLYARADRIIVLARGSGDHLVRQGVPSEKIRFIPNGVDVSGFDAPRAPRSGQPLTFVYAGAHGPANGLDVLLHAAARLQGVANVRFTLVGDGPAKEGLLRLADRLGLENVEFLPPVPKAEVPVLLARADAGLMILRDSPLFRYGVSPNKLFDYMAARLPIVTNVPGEVARMVEDANAGETAAPGSPEALADAMLRLARRAAGERDELGRSARAWVEREHGRPELGRKLHELLSEMVEV